MCIQKLVSNKGIIIVDIPTVCSLSIQHVTHQQQECMASVPRLEQDATSNSPRIPNSQAFEEY